MKSTSRDSGLSSNIREFAATISRQQIGLVLYRPEDRGRPMWCFENAARKVERDGGKVQFGWMFQHRLVADIPGPGYLIAIHHAVWRAPDGQLIDVTPFDADARHQPLAPRGTVLFLIDDAAQPIIVDHIAHQLPLPSKFLSRSNDELLVTHVQQLQRQEEQACRRIYSGESTPSRPS
jgi:hypothetical protein